MLTLGQSETQNISFAFSSQFFIWHYIFFQHCTNNYRELPSYLLTYIQRQYLEYIIDVNKYIECQANNIYGRLLDQLPLQKTTEHTHTHPPTKREWATRRVSSGFKFQSESCSDKGLNCLKCKLSKSPKVVIGPLSTCLIKIIFSCNNYINTRKSVSSDIQTLRSGLKKRGTAEFF